MDNGKENLKKQIREWIKLGYIRPDDIPTIELYMDQVTTFMDKHLEQNKRTDEDKTLTKTMINNYTKNDLLPPPDKKRYSKEHIILLIYIYYLKNVICISDIQVMLKPLIDHYYGNDKASRSLEDIYTRLYNLEKYQYFNVESSVVKAFELSEKSFEETDDPYIKKLNFLSLLGYDIFMKKKLMEHIIDEMSEEQEKEKTNQKESQKSNQKGQPKNAEKPPKDKKDKG